MILKIKYCILRVLGLFLSNIKKILKPVSATKYAEKYRIRIDQTLFHSTVHFSPDCQHSSFLPEFEGKYVNFVIFDLGSVDLKPVLHPRFELWL